MLRQKRRKVRSTAVILTLNLRDDAKPLKARFNVRYSLTCMLKTLKRCQPMKKNATTSIIRYFRMCRRSSKYLYKTRRLNKTGKKSMVAYAVMKFVMNLFKNLSRVLLLIFKAAIIFLLAEPKMQKTQKTAIFASR